MNNNYTGMGGVPMLKIDGSEIRSLRESKGLTQLYLASAVGVTTDTISRWENRRYPTIKRENALKLAEALEVELADILDKSEAESCAEESHAEEVTNSGGPRLASNKSKVNIIVYTLLAVVMVFATVRWWPHVNAGDIEAVRILPAHTAPGQPFPVIIKVKGGNSTFILKEKLPSTVRVVKTDSSSSWAVNDKTGELKWINKVKAEDVTLGYMLKDLKLTENDKINLKGVITLRKFSGGRSAVLGDATIEISLFHWADLNKDYKIDDQEILAVYDDYAEVNGLDVGVDLIEDIWFGSGYRWNPKDKSFDLIP